VNLKIPESLRACSEELDELAKVYSVVRCRSALPLIMGIDWCIIRNGRKRLIFGKKHIT
jgi:hypothetical protein